MVIGIPHLMVIAMHLYLRSPELVHVAQETARRAPRFESG